MWLRVGEEEVWFRVGEEEVWLIVGHNCKDVVERRGKGQG